MKLTRIEVTNYRSLFAVGNDSFELDLADGMNSLIGPNNCGKSNVLRAVALALDPAFPFDREHDKPAGWQWTRVRIALEFRCDSRVQIENTLLRRAHEYELSANGGREQTHSKRGVVRFNVVFQGGAEDGPSRREYLDAGVGARLGDPEKLRRALSQFHKSLRFVLIQSGQSLESLLAGKFREILQTVIQENLRDKFESVTRRRAGYIEGLQGELLDPLRTRIKSVLAALFPEIKDVELVPNVSSIEETLSDVGVNITDAAVTSLAAKGTGVRGAVMVAMLRYLADESRRSVVFAVEEPEAFLHPGAQEDLRDDIEAIAKRTDVTVLVTTHSPFIVSRDPQAKVIALAKEANGRTYVSGQAMGNEPHASLLGGLFRDAALPDILDRAARIPRNARGILIVEGLTDEQFLRLASTRLKRPDLLDGIFITPAGGASKTVVQAVLMKQQTPSPVLVLLDSDDIGRASKKSLVERFNFNAKREVLTYAEVATELAQASGGLVEAEDLFPWQVLDRFVGEKGEATVIRSKTARPSGGWRYDLNVSGKELFPQWLEQNAVAQDFVLWMKAIETIRTRLGLVAVAA